MRPAVPAGTQGNQRPARRRGFVPVRPTSRVLHWPIGRIPSTRDHGHFSGIDNLVVSRSQLDWLPEARTTHERGPNGRIPPKISEGTLHATVTIHGLSPSAPIPARGGSAGGRLLLADPAAAAPG